LAEIKEGRKLLTVPHCVFQQQPVPRIEANLGNKYLDTFHLMREKHNSMILWL